MAPATKAEAIRKLGTLKVSVGYADTWRTYDGLDIQPDDLAGNLRRASLFEYHYNLHRIGQPTDRSEWVLTPQTVNAVNLPLDNGLNFPAAILQPPFFDPQAPAAANYGAIGSIMGHEISHTFDTEGADFDSQGRVRDWWTPADLAHFDQVTTALANQFDTYEPLPGLHVHGRQTLAEDIADLGGINAAYDAFHESLHGQPAPVIGGFTGDQQFFLAFGQNWKSKARPDAERQQILTDPHAPAPVRAETVRNLDSWYTAFDIQPSDKLYLSPDRTRPHLVTHPPHNTTHRRRCCCRCCCSLPLLLLLLLLLSLLFCRCRCRCRCSLPLLLSVLPFVFLVPVIRRLGMLFVCCCCTCSFLALHLPLLCFPPSS